MNDLLLEIRTKKSPSNKLSQEIPIQTLDAPVSDIENPDNVLDFLKADPDIQTLESCLEYLVEKRIDGNSFDIRFPSPLGARIINVLVTSIIPSYWHDLGNDTTSKRIKGLLINSLQSVPGIGAIVARLRFFIATQGGANRQVESYQTLIQALEETLQGDEILVKLSKDVLLNSPDAQRRPLWNELLTLLASSRVISTVAEAEDNAKKAGTSIQYSWLSRGAGYSRWLARNIVEMAAWNESSKQPWDATSQVLRKALLLGYSDATVEELVRGLLVGQHFRMRTLKHLISLLQDHEQRQFFVSLLHFLSRTMIPPVPSASDITSLVNTPREVAVVAAFLQDLISCSQHLTNALIEMLIRDPAAIFGTSSFLLRATIAALQSSDDALETLVEKTLKRFGDRLYIKHTPVLQQEIAARVLLLSSGYLHRRFPMFVFTIARSSEHTHGISNRLAASSSRARWLGMIVGMALSELIDKPESRMVFDNDQIRNDETKWYLQLVHVDDKPGLLQDLRDILKEHETAEVQTRRSHLPDRRKRKQSSKTEEPKAKGKQQASFKILSIVELDDEKEEDDLLPYAKPDSDPEDSEEDPTLIRRNKPRAPVYVRDLIVGLRDTENYDHHHVALTTAAQLIRRKASFGKEVIDHAEELASILMNLNDTFEIDNFEEMKQDALIAVLLSKPASISQIIAQSFFDGDYSIQQRTTMLTALGLGARELAGFKDNDTEAEDVSATPLSSFPSKKLPPHLHKLYSSSQTNSLSRTAAVLEHTTLEPLALAAADKLTGPNALKVRTFSSRLDPSKQAARKKKLTQNKLTTIVADNFFFPLTGRFQSYLRAYGNDSIYFSPYLLPTFLRTLGVILHASGPGTLVLPDMTREFWELLFSLRMTALSEKEVATLEALLFAFLMLLEVNEDKERLAREFAKELVETQEWAKMVLERMQEVNEGDEEGERVRMLAAGVVVRVGEVVERWHRLMLGDMVDVRM